MWICSYIQIKYQALISMEKKIKMSAAVMISVLELKQMPEIR